MSLAQESMANGTAAAPDDAWERLSTNPAVREQQAAFACATGLPLTLLPAGGNAQLCSRAPGEGGLCVKGCLGDGSGSVCERAFRQAERQALRLECPVKYRCPAGLAKIITPIQSQGRHLGTLMAGPFSLKQLSLDEMGRIAQRLRKHGLTGRAALLARSWEHAPIISSDRSQAVATLVQLFANYLAECSQRLLPHGAAQPSPFMRKIEAFLSEQVNDAVSLKAVSECVSLSPCHFCKVFKQQAGMTFSEYRTRMRVERVRQLLVEDQLRVSEAAFEAGFNSIPYFNRAFRRLVGCAPTEYRRRHRAGR